MQPYIYVIHRPRVVLKMERTHFPNTHQARPVNNIFSARKQGLGLATNPLGFVDKMEKFRPRPEPIRLYDLQYSASRALRKKYKDVYHIVYRQRDKRPSLTFVRIKPKINFLFYLFFYYHFRFVEVTDVRMCLYDSNGKEWKKVEETNGK